MTIIWCYASNTNLHRFEYRHYFHKKEDALSLAVEHARALNLSPDPDMDYVWNNEDQTQFVHVFQLEVK